MQRDFLTSERLKALFKSNFELANYAMRLARYKIMAGHEVNVDELLEEVLSQPHRYSQKEIEDLTLEAKQKNHEHSQERGHDRNQDRGQDRR